MRAANIIIGLTMIGAGLYGFWRLLKYGEVPAYERGGRGWYWKHVWDEEDE